MAPVLAGLGTAAGAAKLAAQPALRRTAEKTRNMTLAGCVGLLALLWLAGCAQAATSTAAPAAVGAHPPSSIEGTILSLRAVTVHSDRDPWRIALLADAPGAAAAVAEGSSRLTEFIVRIDDGSTISVVQTHELGLRRGDRVTVLRDGRTHIARPG
jgi:outer membrane lipoprotein SlyB